VEHYPYHSDGSVVPENVRQSPLPATRSCAPRSTGCCDRAAPCHTRACFHHSSRRAASIPPRPELQMAHVLKNVCLLGLFLYVLAVAREDREREQAALQGASAVAANKKRN
jgi:hypothetical protein